MDLQEILKVIQEKKSELQALYKEEAEVKDSAAHFEQEIESLKNKLEEVRKSSTSVFNRKSSLEKEIERLASQLTSVKNELSSLPLGFVAPSSPNAAKKREEIRDKAVEKYLSNDKEETEDPSWGVKDDDLLYTVYAKGPIKLSEVKYPSVKGWQLRKIAFKTGEIVDRTSTAGIIWDLCEYISKTLDIPLNSFAELMFDSKNNIQTRFSILRRIMEEYKYSLKGFLDDNVKMYGFYSKKNQ